MCIYNIKIVNKFNVKIEIRRQKFLFNNLNHIICDSFIIVPLFNICVIYLHIACSHLCFRNNIGDTSELSLAVTYSCTLHATHNVCEHNTLRICIYNERVACSVQQSDRGCSVRQRQYNSLHISTCHKQECTAPVRPDLAKESFCLRGNLNESTVQTNLILNVVQC